MGKKLTLGSLFDGSGGFPLAARMNGIEPVWASEIEPYPIRVTQKNFPNMKHLGDVTKINGAEIPKVDIISFGSPCQGLSVAGKRGGIFNDVRSNLFFESIRIIREMRDSDRATGRADINVRPRFAIWENVPGALSSGTPKGADFQAALQALCDISQQGVSVPLPEGGWANAGSIVGENFSICWRVLNAMYWGVPQRRERIFLTVDFNSDSSSQVLFVQESGGWNPLKGREEEQSASANAEGSVGTSGSC